jgi:outer membrane lipoprotein-sorting protein/curved DNA-binding protein CbpA
MEANFAARIRCCWEGGDVLWQFFPSISPVEGAHMKSLYDLLSARENDDADALKKAFRRAIKANHPDLHPGDPDAAERFMEIIAANACLRDPKQRASYDRLLQLERQRFQTPMHKHQQRRLKRMRATAAVAAVGALISGYGLFAPMLTTTTSEISDDEHVTTIGAVVEKDRQAATVVAAARENENPPTAIAAAKVDAVKGNAEGNVDNAGKPVETTGAMAMAPTDALDQGEPRDKHEGTEVPSGASKPSTDKHDDAQIPIGANKPNADKHGDAQTLPQKEARSFTPSQDASTCFPSASAVLHNHPGGWPTWTLRAPGHEGTRCWYAAARPRGSDHRPSGSDHWGETTPGEIGTTENGLFAPSAPRGRAQGWDAETAPKSRNQAARSQSPMPTDTAGRPIPIPPPESVPYDGSQRALVDRASNYLSSLQSLTGNFVQIGPDGSRSVGKFYLQKPGRVRFEYGPPSPIEVIADGYYVIVRDRNLATQDLHPLSQTPLRYLLADQIDLARDTKVTAVSQDNAFITVTIEERQLLVGTSQLALMFSAKDMQLREWTVTDPHGYKTMIAVYNLDASRDPDPGLFIVNYFSTQCKTKTPSYPPRAGSPYGAAPFLSEGC